MSFIGLFLDGGRAGDGGPVLVPILLTSLRHVNRSAAKTCRAAFKKAEAAASLTSPEALGLTVLHKTVAEAL